MDHAKGRNRTVVEWGWAHFKTENVSQRGEILGHLSSPVCDSGHCRPGGLEKGLGSGGAALDGLGDNHGLGLSQLAEALAFSVPAAWWAGNQCVYHMWVYAVGIQRPPTQVSAGGCKRYIHSSADYFQRCCGPSLCRVHGNHRVETQIGIAAIPATGVMLRVSRAKAPNQMVDFMVAERTWG